MTAVLIPDGAQSVALAAWDQAKSEIGRSAGDAVHWVNVKKPGQRKHLTATIAAIPNVQVISVILCKFHLPNVTMLGQDLEYLYNWPLRLLVERISWFGQRHGVEVATTFAQVKGLSPVRLVAYLDRLRELETKISWSNMRLPPRIDTPANRRMLQIADSASGAVYAAFEADKWGFTEQGYLQMLKPVIWRRPGRPIWKDGLKYGPWPDPSCAAEHPWFDGF